MTIDLNVPFLDLLGKPVTNSDPNMPTPTQGAVLAQKFSELTTGNARQIRKWAESLAQCKPLILDAADAKTFSDTVESLVLPAVTKGAIQETIALALLA